MHKSLLKFLFGKVFALLDVAMDTIRAVYGVIDRSGEFALTELEAAVKQLHDAVDKTIEALP